MAEPIDLARRRRRMGAGLVRRRTAGSHGETPAFDPAVLSTPLAQVTFVIVDVETTGLDPARDLIVEIGSVKVRDGRIVEEYDTLVGIDRTIPFAAQRVNHITNEMLIGKPRIDRVLPTFLNFAGAGTLVEHSHKAFDVGFLEAALGRRLAVPYINTCTLSRRLFPFVPKHSLDECCRRHAIVRTSAHRALGDARATAELLVCLLGMCSTRYPRLGDLLSAASIER
ncbi:MAG TPA: 3'-5' exonuclease [Chloroflexota bacterium]|nr:3'-5' exonuclease [Chloroflexota bacterium]